ncbi:MAG: hypothetical protein KatS3mg105_2264 [Gemmatales bacterium]|nr:MAG: hypothetical protein KatS3mg105_2264 [Gemmatales bacterium]
MNGRLPMQYFLAHDMSYFDGEIAPVLARCRSRRSFACARTLCERLLPRAERFHAPYALPADIWLRLVLEGKPYDRRTWRLLAGEILIYAATEVPAIQVCPPTLLALVGQISTDGSKPQATAGLMANALFGHDDIRFGAFFYRPGSAGMNRCRETARIADYLVSLDPASWSANALLPFLESEDDCREELALARESVKDLAEFYSRACSSRQMVICESV